MMIWILLLLSYLVAGIHSQEIQSIGQCSNEDFIWATGIPKLDFGSSYNCTGLSLCQINWWFRGTRVAAAVLDPYTCVALESSYVSISCSEEVGVLQTNISISNQFNAPSTSSLQFIISGDASLTIAKNVKIQDCTESSPGIDSNGFIPEGTTCDYLCNTTVVCRESVMNSSATCQCNSRWLQVDECLRETTTSATSTDTSVNVATETTNNAVSSNTTTKKGTTNTAISPDTTTKMDSTQPTDSSELSTGGKVGIALGVIAAVVLVSVLLLYLYKKGTICAG